MPINRLLNGLKPDDVERLNRAYTYALRSLHLVDRNDPVTKIVAQKIVEIDSKGVRDPNDIAELAVKQLGH